MVVKLFLWSEGYTSSENKIQILCAFVILISTFQTK